MAHNAARSSMRLPPHSNQLANQLPFPTQEQKRQAFLQVHGNGRNPAHVSNPQSAKMTADSASLRQALRMDDPSLAMSQALQAQSQGIPNASNARVSAPPGFRMPANQLPLDMTGQGFVYVPQMDGKDFSSILPQNAVPVAGVNASMQNMRVPNATSGPNNQSHATTRAPSRTMKNDSNLSNPGRNVNDKPQDDLPISDRMSRGAARLREEALQKDNGDQSVKLKQAETSAKAKSGANSQSANAKNAQQNQAVQSIDNKDTSRSRSASESAKGKGGVSLSRSGSMPATMTSMANPGMKNKGGENGEGENRSTKSDRNTPTNRGSTPSQKSTASGGSTAVERRPSQSGTPRRNRSRNKGRSPGGSRRSRAGGQSARNNSSRSTSAAQTPRVAVNEVKSATALAAQMKASGRNTQGDLSAPMMHANAVMSGLPDGSGPEKARHAKNDANTAARTAGRQAAKAGEEAKLGFGSSAGDNNNEQAAQNAQQGGQSPGPLSATGEAQLFGMEGIAAFSIVGSGHNGKVNGSTGVNYPYELSNFLGTGVEEETMLGNIGNIGTMLNNMQENVDLGSTEFEEDSILGVADAGDLIGRNRT